MQPLRAGLAHHDLAERGSVGGEPLPDPDREILARRVLEARRSRSGSGGRAARRSGSKAASMLGEVDRPSRCRRRLAPTCTSTRNEWPCRRAHLWLGGQVRQPVGGLEGELLEDLGELTGCPTHLVGLEAQPPLRMGEAVVDRQRAVFASTVGAVHRLQEEVVEVERRRIARARRRVLRVDELQLVARVSSTMSAPAFGLTQTQSIPAGGQRAVGLDRDLEAVGVQRVDQRARRVWSSGSPPVQTTKRRDRPFAAAGQLLGDRVGEIRGGAELPAARSVGARRSRCRRTGRPRSRDRSRARSTGCSRRSGRTPPAGRCSRPRPAACRRSP